MFIHDLDESDNKTAKECIMLGLPFQSMFTDEVSIGDGTIEGQQLKWSVFMILQQKRCIELFKNGYSHFVKQI